MIWLGLVCVTLYVASIAIGAAVAGRAGAANCARYGVFGLVKLGRRPSS